MKSKLSLLKTFFFFAVITVFSNTASATLIYSDQFEATNETLGSGYQFYSLGHYATEEFLNTGLASADKLEVDLNVRNLPSSGTIDLEFLLNDNLIGGISTADLTNSINELVFNFAELESATEAWTLTMIAVTPACIGCGSLWLEELHDISLISSTAVSEPSTFAILMLGLFGLITRRKQL
ncbi:PEP-CTERM sorting domain-containing protein [Agarivorans aestuarii]|uniref:PEP-CTERM sorting domain-containing protein n=1 Tax=Agarivorans aestuarii TaxID=1563703 RepID=A0ABU7G245_9ALTE|nr:PEP-CTERM sorting domain-containing protein [Agarivorans aestuarii]MEE1673254.1 PEP-CTERM sorting domain-containing protein [Agarivorans aestuarii]